MKTNLEDSRSVTILIDEQKNLAIFPKSKSDKPWIDPMGYVFNEKYGEAFFPIELKYPYTADELAEKIKQGINLWMEYPFYDGYEENNVTFEAKYYGVKGFKNAMKGKKQIDLGWDDVQGKSVRLYIPYKRGYCYAGVRTAYLPDDADWSDFAAAVLELIDLDVFSLDGVKGEKSKLNL